MKPGGEKVLPRVKMGFFKRQFMRFYLFNKWWITILKKQQKKTCRINNEHIQKVKMFLNDWNTFFGHPQQRNAGVITAWAIRRGGSINKMVSLVNFRPDCREMWCNVRAPVWICGEDIVSLIWIFAFTTRETNGKISSSGLGSGTNGGASECSVIDIPEKRFCWLLPVYSETARILGMKKHGVGVGAGVWTERRPWWTGRSAAE